MNKILWADTLKRCKCLVARLTGPHWVLHLDDSAWVNFTTQVESGNLPDPSFLSDQQSESQGRAFPSLSPSLQAWTPGFTNRLRFAVVLISSNAQVVQFGHPEPLKLASLLCMCPNQTFWALPHIHTRLNVPGFHIFPSQAWDQPLLKRSWFLWEAMFRNQDPCKSYSL